MAEPFKKLMYFLQEKKDLCTLLDKVNALNNLSEKIARYWGEQFTQQYQIANYKNNTLIIFTTNAAMATQMHYLAPDLIKKLKQDPELKAIERIICKVKPLQIQKQKALPTLKKIALLSKATAQLMQKAASTLKDKKLKEIMERIAGHTTEKRESIPHPQQELDEYK